MMQIPASRLREHLSGDGGGRLERLWFDLLQADAFACGISANKVHWDDRTNVGDGGRDLVVEEGAAVEGLLIPGVPSVWSIKSGEDGKKPSTLKNELKEAKHPKVVAALRDGWKYFHCTIQPIKQDERDELRNTANEIAGDIGIDRAQIEFWHSTELASQLEMFPGIVGNHLSHLLPPPEFSSIEEWERLEAEVRWADFGNRSGLVQQLRSHFTNTGGRKTLHIGGISGIGKTRTALEAVCCDELRSQVIYFERYEKFGKTMHWLLRNQGARAFVVVDEVDIEQFAELQRKAVGFGDRVRVLSIGPVRRDQASRPELLVVPEPGEEQDVLAVLRSAAGTTIREEVLQILAPVCNHDLRLGLLLLKVIRNDPELAESPAKALDALAVTTAVYQRVLGLFAMEIAKAPRFGEDYPALTFSDDIGCKEERADELDIVADRLQKDVNDLQATAQVAARCGLGTFPGRYFEAAPRALAVMVFQDILWPRISGRLSGILKDVPDRLLLSFVRRVELCSDNVKEEVRRECGDFFRHQLEGIEIESMADSALARNVRAWCELYPDDGLSWLRSRITSASPDELRGLRGSTGMFGPSGGRRDLVWACEHLACFSDYFDDAESVLFALAVAENESIGNNATNVWQKKFRHVLSNTETPFSHRRDVLLARLASASNETIELVLGAVAGTLDSHLSAMNPPAVIGGRVVPPEWRPETSADARAILDDLVARAIQAVSAHDELTRSTGAGFVAQRVRSFWRLSAHEQMRTLLTSENLTEGALRDLREALRQVLEVHGSKFTGADLIQAWIEDLAPRALSDRLKEVVSRPVWDHQRRARREDAGDSWTDPYREIAGEISRRPDELRHVLGWLESGEAKSSRALGAVLAEDSLGESDDIREIVLECLSAGASFEFVAGYLGGAAHRDPLGLPEWARAALDELSASAPERCALLSVEVDVSRRGFDRLISCCESPGVERSRPLSLLYGAPWGAVLRADDQARVLDLLLDATEPTSPAAAHQTALHLVTMWRHGRSEPLPTELRNAIVRIVMDEAGLSGAGSSYEWTELVPEAAEIDPDRVVGMLCELAFGVGAERSARRHEAGELLPTIAARHGRVLLGFIGRQISSKEGRVIFFMSVFRGLFEAIGPDEVIRWIQDTGEHAAHAVARHIQSPHLDSSGEPVLPPLTGWLLREYGEDEKFFNEFMCGRHSFEVRSGQAWEWGPAIQESAEPFLGHDIPAVRRWAKLEIDQVKHEIEQDRKMLDEWGRD